MRALQIDKPVLSLAMTALCIIAFKRAIFGLMPLSLHNSSLITLLPQNLKKDRVRNARSEYADAISLDVKSGLV